MCENNSDLRKKKNLIRLGIDPDIVDVAQKVGAREALYLALYKRANQSNRNIQSNGEKDA